MNGKIADCSLIRLRHSLCNKAQGYEWGLQRLRSGFGSGRIKIENYMMEFGRGWHDYDQLEHPLPWSLPELQSFMAFTGWLSTVDGLWRVCLSVHVLAFAFKMATTRLTMVEMKILHAFRDWANPIKADNYSWLLHLLSSPRASFSSTCLWYIKWLPSLPSISAWT